MRIRCVGRYRTQAVDYAEGAEIDLSDEQATALLVDSPGSFVRVDEGPASDVGEVAVGESAATEPAPQEDEPDLSAMSTETQTGLVVPDRRARGGRKRT